MEEFKTFPENYFKSILSSHFFQDFADFNQMKTLNGFNSFEKDTQNIPALNSHYDDIVDGVLQKTNEKYSEIIQKNEQ